MTAVNGKTKVFGLLGNPIEHTSSPFIHQLFYDELGYNGIYNPFFVPEGELENAILGMKGLSIKGLNVTVPYKVEVMEFLDRVDAMAMHIGACNTIVREGEDFVGYNTDWIGLKMACDHESIPIEGKDVVIIGAGGSARAIAFMCQRESANSITILNRTVEKAEAIAAKVKAVNQDVEIRTGGLDELDLVLEGSVAIQTTSLGMHPKVDRCPIEDDEFYSKVDFIVDIIYNPKETLFMKKGSRHGAKTMNGLGMLYFQAVKAFELWTGLKLDKGQLQRGLTKLRQYVYNENQG